MQVYPSLPDGAIKPSQKALGRLGLRRCTGCGETMPATPDVFNRHGRFLESRCKVCTAKALALQRRADPERGRAYRSDPVRRAKQNARCLAFWRDNSAQIMYRTWRKQGCVVCGESDVRAVEGHHRDPVEKERNLSGITDVVVMAAELAKCIPICANHHRILHDELRNGLNGVSIDDATSELRRRQTSNL